MRFFSKNTFISTVLVFLNSLIPVAVVFLTGMVMALALASFVSFKLEPVLISARIDEKSTKKVDLMEDVDAEEIRLKEMEELLVLNPFDIPLKKEIIISDDRSVLQKEDVKVFSVDGIKVIGSLPDVAAWLSESKQVTLILMDQSYKGFTLKKVLPYSVVLRKDKKLYEVYISYKDGGKSVSSGMQEPEPPKEVRSLEPGKQVEAASDGREGIVARELVDSLLMNPFNELKRVRLVPEFVDGKPTGIKVANIMDGSVLKELGVKKGDIVKSVNGVVIRNMGDIANAINSLMGGNRFEVSVGRADEEIMLNYVVK